MKTCNSRYFNNYLFTNKFLLVLICCFLLACSKQNITKQVLSDQNQFVEHELAVNINTASAVELEKLPHVGEKLAQAIIEHRQKFGRFRKPEHLLLVRGISDERYREIRNLIRIE